MNGVELAALESEEEIKLIKAFVGSSPYLEFTKNYHVRPRQVYVDVVSFKHANKVISELTKLVKISSVDNSYFSKVTVKQVGSSLTKFYVSYHKKVLFLSKNKERITRDIATYLIKNFN
ncbi:MAG: hypothetical protein QM500_12705 [Methylococcales bacterium]